MNPTLESIAEQDARRAIAINKPMFDLIDQIFNLSGSRVEGSHERDASAHTTPQMSAMTTGDLVPAGSNPASPTIQQPPMTAEEHNKFPRGRW